MMDVLQLADVFEAFRHAVFTEHSIDPVNYVTLPSIAWSIATKMMMKNNNSFHLLTDGDMYRFFEDGKYGRMSFINEHVVVSTLEEEASWLACYDVNNLYAEGMSSLLPANNFEWVEPSALEVIDWYSINTEGEECYILKVDLTYPKEIHDETLDLPLAPTNESITWQMLTAQQKHDYENMCVQ